MATWGSAHLHPFALIMIAEVRGGLRLIADMRRVPGRDLGDLQSPPVYILREHKRIRSAFLPLSQENENWRG